MVLDLWLGSESIQYFRERDLKEVIRRHIVADEAEIARFEGLGAMNFLAIDDLLVTRIGEPVDPKSIIELPVSSGKPVFPNYTRVKKLNTTKTSLNDWMKTVLDEQVNLEDVCCEFELASDIYAQIDQEKLRQVMINLITNAVHALLAKKSNGKLLQISTHLFDDEYEIRVRDNGTGMSDESREKVFEPLYSTKGFGVGLGMVIAKGIVEQHHGEISVESMDGKGTTVTLRPPD